MGLEVIRIFISHAEDTRKECELVKEIIQQESELHYEKQGYKLEVFCWDDIPRGAGDPQEDLIDPHIRDEKCKLIVMILWVRFGSPTQKYESGIDHEYHIIKECKKNVLIFFGNKNVRPFAIDTQQLEKVQEFKKKIEYDRYCGHCGFFEDEKDFEKNCRGQIVSNIDKIIMQDRNISTKFKALTQGF